MFYIEYVSMSIHFRPDLHSAVQTSSQQWHRQKTWRQWTALYDIFMSQRIDRKLPNQGLSSTASVWYNLTAIFVFFPSLKNGNLWFLSRLLWEHMMVNSMVLLTRVISCDWLKPKSDIHVSYFRAFTETLGVLNKGLVFVSCAES